jgi:hypothetical protein
MIKKGEFKTLNARNALSVPVRTREPAPDPLKREIKCILFAVINRRGGGGGNPR